MKAKLEWQPRDLWVGIYWRAVALKTVTWEYRALHVWVCILPCIPIHLTFRREKEK